MTGGQIVVDVDKTAYPDGVVELDLMGANLTNTSTSPIYVAAIGDECQIVAKKGYENTISDGTSYTNADGKAAAIYACDDLKIKGSGTLTVNGNCDEGIACKNDIKLWNGNIKVNAVGDGIRGKDSVKIGDADSTDYSGLNVTVKSTGALNFFHAEPDLPPEQILMRQLQSQLLLFFYSFNLHNSLRAKNNPNAICNRT